MQRLRSDDGLVHDSHQHQPDQLESSRSGASLDELAEAAFTKLRKAVDKLPDDPADPAWPPAIEIAVHAAGRYRLIGLTPSQARELARALARTADMLTALAPGTGEGQDQAASARSGG